MVYSGGAEQCETIGSGGVKVSTQFYEIHLLYPVSVSVQINVNTPLDQMRASIVYM